MQAALVFFRPVVTDDPPCYHLNRIYGLIRFSLFDCVVAFYSTLAAGVCCASQVRV